MFVYLLLISVLLAYFLIRDHLRRSQPFDKDVPEGDAEKSFLGMNYTLLSMTDEERFEHMNGKFLQFDRLFQERNGPVVLLGLCHPDLVQQILSDPDCLEKPFFYDFIKFDQGILHAKWKLWKSQRKALNPTFNLRILHGFLPIFEKCSLNLVEKLDKCKIDETVNMFKYTSRCALEMVCGTTLGSDVLERDGKDVFLESLQEAMVYVAKRMLSFHLHLDLIYMMTPYYWRERTLRKQFKIFINKIIQEKKEAKRVSTLTQSLGSDLEEDDLKKPQIVIKQLLTTSHSSRQFTDEEIYHNAFVIMAAGNDTSGLTMAYACLFLAMYPHMQEKVYTEIMEHCPTEDVAINIESHKRLEYMDLFLKEVMRHCPPAPIITRKCIKDIVVDGVHVPAGNMLFCSFWAMHRRKDMWGPNAELFDPDNFLPERCQNRNPNAFMPFSVGARNCIGGRYAMISMKVMLVYILRRFKVLTKLKHEEMRFKFGVTLKLSTDYPIQLERRNGA